jgi:uncharacterized protein (TIGR04222 family)
VNPFDLRGPQFLAFYAILCALTLGTLAILRRVRESGGSRLRLTDPYLIAYLRGGPREALRMAVVSLVGRGLLGQAGTLLETVADGVERTRHALEKAILERFQRGADAGVIFGDLLLLHEVGDLRRTLERHGLLPDEALRQDRRQRLAIGLGALGAIGLVKAIVALSRGHGNLGFLLAMAVGTSLVAASLTLASRTVKGDAMLADLRTLFARLRARAHTLGREAAEEALLLAAVFGLDSLPWRWAFARELFPKAAKSGSDGSWSSSGCGSSCGSSGGSGGSCGGGCGGGCGGCGS